MITKLINRIQLFYFFIVVYIKNKMFFLNCKAMSVSSSKWKIIYSYLICFFFLNSSEIPIIMNRFQFKEEDELISNVSSFQKEKMIDMLKNVWLFLFPHN